MARGVSLFSETNPVGYSHLLDLCRDPEEFRIYLFKSGLLGDRTGICESCKQGNVYLTKKEGSSHWKCGARACRKTISITKGSFFERSKLDFKVILCLFRRRRFPIRFGFSEKVLCILHIETEEGFFFSWLRYSMEAVRHRELATKGIESTMMNRPYSGQLSSASRRLGAR